MKRRWTLDELIDHWALLPNEIRAVNHARTDKNRLGLALLLKWFQHENRFPRRKQEIPADVLDFLARQLSVEANVFRQYALEGRTIARHRMLVREFYGFRESTVEDAVALTDWLVANVLPQHHKLDALATAVYDRCRILHLEPPSPQRIERIIRSAINTADERFYEITRHKLTSATCVRLDALLNTSSGAEDAKSDSIGRSTLHQLKQGVGAVKLESVFAELDKLQTIVDLELPADLFADCSPKVLEKYRQRIAVEGLHEVRRHPDPLRYTLLAAFCWQRQREIIDTLVDLLIDIIHRMKIKAERKTEKVVLRELKRVRGKGRLLYEIAEASVNNPDSAVREVIFPVADEQTLRDVIVEFKTTGTYDRQVRTRMRRSYGQHYRRMVPSILKMLTFRSNNEAYQPIIAALSLLKTYADSDRREYAEMADVPIEGVIPPTWRYLVIRQTKRSGQRINRISYELCVLWRLRDSLRCKEIWVEKADRYRNPDEDVPTDFPEQRELYYAELQQPLDDEAFVRREKQALANALAMLNHGMPRNNSVTIGERHGKSWITVTPLDALSEPVNLLHLKAEVKRRWDQTSLLDMLKETDLRVHFTRLFKSATAYENLPRSVLQKRLLFCLYGYGTNTGLSRVAAGDDTVNARDLLYVRRRFINIDNLRAAIQTVVNEILRIRHPEWWGAETTACASDAKKFGAWDQNLLTEWHIRYRGPGIMVYWHVEKKSVCIYSQIKRCSSSEVAAMIEGVLRHCTDMTIQKNYVDTHGQSEVAFAFTHLLGFQLMPRLKGIGRQRLYLPDTEDAELYPHLQTILSRGIRWNLIQQQYDEMIKYATALRLGTAEAEAILRRFTRTGVQHPTYRALAELGKARKTIFLCHYLHDEEIRREIQAGLNVIENWNSTNGFIFYGKSGELATNKREDQQMAILSLHLLQICMVYINTLMLQQVLGEEAWRQRMGDAERRGLSPLFYTHVNPYGEFNLDMEKRIALTDATILQ
jgi:TnpA family transposase